MANINLKSYLDAQVAENGLSLELAALLCGLGETGKKISHEVSRGALAGVLGIVISVLLIIPINYIIHTLTGQTNISAILPPVAAILLIVLSIVLTLIGGIIPSREAARSDPVTALRSE